MIKLGPYPPVPDKLVSSKVIKAMEAIKECIALGEKVRSSDYKPYWREVKEDIHRHHRGKCCYCERKRNRIIDSDVEHFRPKAAVTEDRDHPGYWWLAYTLENYLLACKTCNSDSKRNHFPLLPGGKRAFGPDDNLNEEKPTLLHPVKDDPEKYIGFEWKEGGRIFVKAIGLDPAGRGAATCRLTGINDNEVMEERRKLLSLLEVLVWSMKEALESNDTAKIDKYGRKIKEETRPDQSFAGFRRAFFKAEGLGDYIDTSS